MRAMPWKGEINSRTENAFPTCRALIWNQEGSAMFMVLTSTSTPPGASQ